MHRPHTGSAWRISLAAEASNRVLFHRGPRAILEFSDVHISGIVPGKGRSEFQDAQMLSAHGVRIRPEPDLLRVLRQVANRQTEGGGMYSRLVGTGLSEIGHHLCCSLNVNQYSRSRVLLIQSASESSVSLSRTAQSGHGLVAGRCPSD